MTILAAVLIGFILFYIGFLILTSAFSSKYIVISRVSSTLLGENKCNVRISTAIINESDNPKSKQVGLVFIGNKITPASTNGASHISKDLILPISREEILSTIEILKNGAPLHMSLGNKKQLKISLSEDSNSMKILFNTSFLFRQAFLVKVPANSMNELISGLERLLKEESRLTEGR